jgi:FtsP/CotA-like multicopper oxidase with cupredoxin domain
VIDHTKQSAGKSARNSKTLKNLTARPSRIALAVSMALMAPAAMQVAYAGAGTVCRDNDNTVSPPKVYDISACPSGTIGTYYANSPKLRKFVDTIAGLTSGGANTFADSTKTGEYIAIAEPDTSSYPGSEYFVIGVIEHEQWMHSDLQKATTQRSYVQLYPPKSERAAVFGTGAIPNPQPSAYAGFGAPNPGAPVALTYPNGNPILWPGTNEQVYGYDKAHYLGPIVITFKGTPVRIKFVNFLPNGSATTNTTVSNGVTTKNVTARNGDMFLPTDESLAGAGLSADGANKYPQNRVAFHLHGGDSPWISDGTPHQWIAASGENLPAQRQHGDRFMNTPDMPFPGDGAQTTFWPNDQSSRLMWYHDHTFGLTRQNAYSGAAAGYVIIDPAELALLTGTPLNGTPIQKAIPGGLLEQIVLVVQDKGFVPDDIAVQDSKWDQNAWGKPGDLWYPHVYEPFQVWDKSNSNFAGGAPGQSFDPAIPPSYLNPAGRWDYAVDDATTGYRIPFVPLRDDPDYGKVAFPDGTYTGGPSATPESYMDTPVVNGIAYPVLNVEPKAYRVRFLNGANDRYWNLSLWVADTTAPVTDTSTGKTTAANTEVKMVPADGNATYNLAGGNTYVPADNRPGGVPDPATAGPSIIRFANEGGLLAAPVVHMPSPMNGGNDSTGAFTLARDAGANFYLGGAERADTVIDFSQYAGKTLILYNDSSAPVPGGDSRYDYYTGDDDQSGFGGAPTTLPGFGPNTRTVMQIVVAATQANGVAPAAPYDSNGTGGLLATELPKAYAASADAHIVASGTVPTLVTSADSSVLLNGLPTPTMVLNGITEKLKVKTIQGFTDPNFGRLIAQIGTELQNEPVPGTNQYVPNAGLTATPLGYIDAPTDIISDGETQYWWIKNNDVDNHPMHFHLFNVQVIARVDHFDNTKIYAPQPDETGWKETVKNWPLEDVIVAVKPKTPALPFGLPKSVRNLDPTLPAGVSNSTFNRPGADLVSAFFQNDVVTGLPFKDSLGNIVAVKNTANVDFDWEYVWHCHILGHEENDLMRPLVFHPAPPTVPTTLPGSVAVDATGKVTWTDPTPFKVDAFGTFVSSNASGKPTTGNTDNEIGFRVERAPVTTSVSATGIVVATTGSFTTLPTPATSPVVDGRVNTLANVTVFQDAAASASTAYAYRVVSVNEGGDAVSNPSFNAAATPPAAVGSLSVGSVGTSAGLTWLFSATTGVTGYQVYRATVNYGVVGAFAPLTTVASTLDTYTDSTIVAGTDYQYQVVALKGAIPSTTNPVATLAQAPLAATSLTASAVAGTTLTLTWLDGSTNEDGFSVESTTDGTNWVLLATTLPNTLTYNVTGLQPGSYNTFRVAATKNLNGYTPTYTTTPVIYTPATLVAPLVTVLSSLVSGLPQAQVKWTSTSVGQTGFTVERCAGTTTTCAAATANWTLLTTALGTALSYLDTTLATGATYVYRVKAVALNTLTGVTAVGALASSGQTATAVAVSAPSNLTATSPTGVGVTLTWLDNSTNETSFQVSRSGGAVAFVPVNVTRTAALKAATGGTVTYADATALAGTAYSYTVVAINTVGTTVSASPAANISIATAMPAPTGLTAVQSGANIALTWTDTSATETSFEVLRTDTSGLTAVTYPVARTAAQATSVNRAVTYSDIAAVPGTVYTYAVRAVNTAAPVAPALTGVSTYSGYTANATASVVIPAPTQLSTALPAAGTGVLLTWVDNATFETGYRIDRAIITDPGSITGLVPATTVFAPLATVARTGNLVTTTGAVSYTDPLTATPAAGAGQVYAYQVVALKGTAASLPSNAAHSNAAVAMAGAPTGLTAVTSSGTSVVLSWIDNSINEVAFQVTRTDPLGATVTFTTPARTGTAKTGVGSKVSYTDATAALGTLYTYTVAPVTTAAIALTATTPAVAAVTGPSSLPIKAGLTLNTPLNPTATQTATGITIGWTDNSTNEIGFQIVRTGVTVAGGTVLPVTFNVTSTATQKTATGTARTYIDTTAVPGVTYSYTVATTGGTTLLPVYSTAISTTPVTITEVIVAPSAPTAVITSATRITVSWTDLSTNETGFLVERLLTPTVAVAGAAAPTWTTLATVARTGTATTGINGGVSYVDNLVVPVVQGTYQYRVSAVNVTGAVTNAASTAVASNVLDFNVPTAPTLLTATAGAVGSVTLNWTDNATNETGFTVQRSTSATFPAGATTVTTAIPGANAATGPVPSFSLNGLTTGSKLFFRLAATNAAGTSTYAATAVAVTVP